MNGVAVDIATDPAAPNVGTMQMRINVTPLDGPLAGIGVIKVHGSDGDAGSSFATSPDNNPNYPNQLSYRRANWTNGLAACGLPTICHDFNAINPVTGVMDVNQFGTKAVMDLIDHVRVDLMPRIGCRSDKVILQGGSQGSLDVMMYLLQHPGNVAAALLLDPGGDVEANRLSSRGLSINQNWGYAAGSIWTLRLGVGGPSLPLRGTWAPNTAYNVNDVVSDPAKVANLYGAVNYRCILAHTSGSTFNAADAVHWQALDPMAIHYSVPSEGGTSLAFQSGTPFAGQPASLFEPAWVTRMADIVAGRITGTPVPVLCYWSAGDEVTMGRGSNGTLNHVPWYMAKIRAHATKVSDVFNHGGQILSPQPMDPAYASSASLANAQVLVKRAGGNQQLMFQLSGSWSGSVVFEATTSTTGVGGWVPVNANPTVAAAANSGTEGANVTAATVNGFYRMNTNQGGTNYVFGRVRKTGTGNPVNVTGGPTYPSDIEQSGTDVREVARNLFDLAA